MKRILLLLIVGGFFFTDIVAQNIELGGFYGYNLNTRVRTYYGDYTLYNNPYYGGQLSVGLASDVFVELTYNRSDTEMNYYYNNNYEPIGVSSEYFQVGGLRQIPISTDAVLPFGSFSLGTTRFNLKESTVIFSPVINGFFPLQSQPVLKYYLERALEFVYRPGWGYRWALMVCGLVPAEEAHHSTYPLHNSILQLDYFSGLVPDKTGLVQA